MNLQESIRRILREETKLPLYVARRYNCMDDYISLLEKEPEIIPIRVGRLDWEHYQIILTAYIRNNCGDGNGYYDPDLHELIMNVFGERLFNWYIKNIW